MTRTVNMVRTRRSHIGRTIRWLPWLIVAVGLAWLLWPNPITASRLVFQSAVESPLPEAPPPEEAAPEPPPEEQPPSEPAPVEEQAPEEEAPAEEVPVELPAPTATERPAAKPIMPGVPPPGEEAATEPAAAEAAPEEPAATRPVEAVPATRKAPVSTRRAQSGTLVDEPLVQPGVEDRPAAPSGGSVINWSKFWDTVAVTFSYSWLCCGIVLLLGLPLGIVLLEIKGRRRPRKLPELPGPRSQPPGPGPTA
jgi:hypothetical protein